MSDPSLPLITPSSNTSLPLPPSYSPKSRSSLVGNLKRDLASIDTFIPIYSEGNIKNVSLLPYLRSSIFTNPESLKLANVDAPYKLTRHIGAFMHLTTPGPFKFCDLNSRSSAWTQYVQWRRPDSIGYGLVHKWNLNVLDINRFMPFYGESNTGDLNKEWKAFVNRVRRDQSPGVDLVMGSIEIPESASQEFLSFRPLVIELLTSLRLLGPNGDMILKIYETSSQPLAELIYLASLCFEQTSIIRPLTANGSEKYLICKVRRNATEGYELILDQIIATLNNEEVVMSFLSQPLPDDFINWLLIINNQSNDNPDEIDAHEALIIWNLPGDPTKEDKETSLLFSNVKT